jgi:hypothetical protein
MSCTLVDRKIPRFARNDQLFAYRKTIEFSPRSEWQTLLRALVVETAENMKFQKRRRAAVLLKVDGALVVEEREVAEQVVGDALGFGFGVERVKFFGDLLDGVRAVAELHDFQAGTIETQGAFGHEEHTRLLRFFVEATAGSEAGSGGEFGLHHDSLAGWKAPGGGQPGLT